MMLTMVMMLMLMMLLLLVTMIMTMMMRVMWGRVHMLIVLDLAVLTLRWLMSQLLLRW